MTSKAQNSVVGNEPVSDVGHKPAKAAGLSSEAQSGVCFPLTRGVIWANVRI